MPDGIELKPWSNLSGLGDTEHFPGLAWWVRLEAEEEEGRAQGRTWSTRIHLSVAYFLWLGPTN